MNSNDTTRTGPTTAHAGGTVVDPTHGAPANPGLDLIRHRTRSVPGHSVTGLSRRVFTLVPRPRPGADTMITQQGPG